MAGARVSALSVFMVREALDGVGVDGVGGLSGNCLAILFGCNFCLHLEVSYLQLSFFACNCLGVLLLTVRTVLLGIGTVLLTIEAFLLQWVLASGHLSRLRARKLSCKQINSNCGELSYFPLLESSSSSGVFSWPRINEQPRSACDELQEGCVSKSIFSVHYQAAAKTLIWSWSNSNEAVKGNTKVTFPYGHITLNSKTLTLLSVLFSSFCFLC